MYLLLNIKIKLAFIIQMSIIITKFTTVYKVSTEQNFRGEAFEKEIMKMFFSICRPPQQTLQTVAEGMLLLLTQQL